ncbi:hypothetical protein LINPERPRIM_LOCUS20684, partial [Linum perenne]
NPNNHCRDFSLNLPLSSQISSTSRLSSSRRRRQSSFERPNAAAPLSLLFQPTPSLFFQSKPSLYILPFHPSLTTMNPTLFSAFPRPQQQTQHRCQWFLDHTEPNATTAIALLSPTLPLSPVCQVQWEEQTRSDDN